MLSYKVGEGQLPIAGGLLMERKILVMEAGCQHAGVSHYTLPYTGITIRLVNFLHLTGEVKSCFATGCTNAIREFVNKSCSNKSG